MGKITVLTDSTVSSGSAAPGNVSAILALGTIDPQSGEITPEVTVTPPSPLGTFVGCEVYLEAPDQSANAPNTVGVAPVGTVPVGGSFKPIPCGKQAYVASQQPWVFTVQAPSTINWTVSTACRVYCDSYSNAGANTLVEANQSNPTPSTAFNLVPVAAPSPTSAASAVADITNFITVSSLGNFNVNGKLETAFEVIVYSVPDIPNYVYRLVATAVGQDPTKIANQHVISGALTQAGFVQSAGTANIPIPYSFILATPTTTQNWILWMQSGTAKNSKYTWNPLVPGITPSYPFSLGSTSGTMDASALLISSLASYFSITGPLLGIEVDGITIQNTGGQFALVANGIDAGVYIKDGTILSAKIGYEQVVDSNIYNLNAAKVNFGTMSGITITAVTISASSMSSITMTASTLTCTQNGVTTSIQNSNPFPAGLYCGLTVDTGWASTGSAVGVCSTGIVCYNYDLEAFRLTTAGSSGSWATALTLAASDSSSIVLQASIPAIVMNGNTGYTGTLAAAISAGKNVLGGIIY
jgi:hypothetical protein